MRVWREVCRRNPSQVMLGMEPAVVGSTEAVEETTFDHGVLLKHLVSILESSSLSLK